jgi:hypothetical protein
VARANSDAKTLGSFQKRVGDLLAPIFFYFYYCRSTEGLFTYDADAVAIRNGRSCILALGTRALAMSAALPEPQGSTRSPGNTS